MENAIIRKSFVFNSVKIRTAIIDGEPWFVAKDVCDVLELTNITETLRGLESDELTSVLLKSGGQDREMRLVSESGLYTLVFKSRKPEAKAFRKWVTSELKPALENLKEVNMKSLTAINSSQNAVMQKFSFRGSNIRTAIIDGEPWFVAKDVAEALGYANPNDAIKQHCKDGVAKRYPILDALGRTQEVRIIREPDLYRLIVGSTLPAAQKFEAWIFEEVLPTIRKTGGYTDMIPKDLPTALRAYANEVEKNQKLLAENNALQKSNLSKSLTITRNKPKVLFADAVAASDTSILVGDLARILKQNGINIGQNRLFVWMRENGYLIKKRRADYNMPTQKSMNAGLFEIKESVVNTPDGSIHVTRTPKVTGAGQVFFINQFLRDKK